MKELKKLTYIGKGLWETEYEITAEDLIVWIEEGYECGRIPKEDYEAFKKQIRMEGGE